jgi:hypothetical protein
VSLSSSSLLSLPVFTSNVYNLVEALVLICVMQVIFAYQVGCAVTLK